MNCLFLIILISLCVISCNDNTKFEPNVNPIPIISTKCAYKPIKIKLRFREEVTLPMAGRAVLESHYVTKKDYLDGRTWPINISHGISDHLKRGCKEYQKFVPTINCNILYKLSYSRIWTPSEGGQIGQGCVGKNKPTVSQETWQGTMYWDYKIVNGKLLWDHKPKMGTKFLACNTVNNKCVVISMGFERGPYSTKYIAGLSPETHFYLKSSNSTKTIEIGLLKNQSIEYGPINCK